MKLKGYTKRDDFMSEERESCGFCRGEYELFIIDDGELTVFDIEELKRSSRRVKFCPVCGKELEGVCNEFE